MAVCRFPFTPILAGLLSAFAAMALFSLTSCSLVLELDSCDDENPCPEGYQCTDDNLCLSSSAQCTTDEDCLPIMGEGSSCEDNICRGDDPLLGGPCQQLYGAADGDGDELLIGVVLQLSGVGGGFGQPMLDAMQIAKRDFNAIGGIDGRSIRLVACDTAYDDLDPADYGEDDDSLDTIARIAAQHLVDEAGVEVIVGFNSSQVLDVGPNITVPNDVLLMSPSATAAIIPPAGHNGLMYRTAPSDEPQAIALTNLVEETLDDYLLDQGVEDGKITILVREDDQWAEGLYEHLVLELPPEITGADADRFSSYFFPNVGAGGHADYTPVAAAVAAEERPPDVVVVLGSADSWQVIEYVDQALSEEPLFIGGDAMKNLQEATQAPAALENRIWGTGPRNVAEFDYQPYTIFRLKFETEMSDNADNYQFVANAFDAIYAVAFGAAAEGFSGPEIAEGLTRLGSGDNILPSSTDAQTALEILSQGQSINYQGASGPLNFDENGDPEPLPIALWCFEDGQIPERGEIYNHETGIFEYMSCDPENDVEPNDNAPNGEDSSNQNTDEG